MNRSELVKKISDVGLSHRECEVAVERVFDVIMLELLAGGNVSLTGYGKFSVSNHKARNGVNPRTGKPINVKSSKHVTFKANRRIQMLLNSINK